MLKNYLKTALRNITKQKAYSIINIMGFSVAIAVTILIILFVSDENNFDTFNHNYNRIARIITTSKTITKDIRKKSLSGAGLGERLRNEYPEINNSVAMVDRYSFGRFTVQYGQNKYYESEYLITQPSFLKIFDFKVIRSVKNYLLSEPNEMVLTESTAKKFFGDENPIGKVIKTDRSWGNFKVTGLVQDPPKNSHIQFSMLISFKSLEHYKNFYKALESPDYALARTYLLFKNPVGMKGFDKKLSEYESNHKGKKFGVTEHISLQPMSDIHYGSQNIGYDYVNYASRNKTTIYILEILGLLIIIIAGINYTNLASARSINRAKEIGVRKVIGALRKQLVGQFLIEAVLLSVMSMLIALILVEIFLPSFNSFTGKDISIIKGLNIIEVTSIVFVTLLVGLISGSLPALFLSKLKPVLVLNNNTQP
ncbi:MAG: ABC transporter permease, partial [Ignavibacteriaceae bacterium]